MYGLVLIIRWAHNLLEYSVVEDCEINLKSYFLELVA